MFYWTQKLIEYLYSPARPPLGVPEQLHVALVLLEGELPPVAEVALQHVDLVHVLEDVALGFEGKQGFFIYLFIYLLENLTVALVLTFETCTNDKVLLITLIGTKIIFFKKCQFFQTKSFF